MIYEEELKYILHLLRCAVSDKTPPNPQENLDWEVIFKIAQKHRITSTIFYGLQKLPQQIQHIPHFNDFFTAYQKNLILDANRSFEINNLKSEFETHNIDYVLLKGSVTKHLYPDTSMRVMSDIDILFRTGIANKTQQNQMLISLMKKNEYKIWAKGPSEIGFYKPLAAISSNMRIEMQTFLIDEGYDVWFAYLNNIWSRLTPKNNGHEYIMSDEDFYIYHIIHMAKHFLNGGIGIIHILDVYVINNALRNLDRQYISSELKKVNLFKFENIVRMLADYWFKSGYAFNDKSSGESKDTLDLMEEYIISGGAFGTKTRQEINHIVRRDDGKVSLLKKIFPESSTMIDYYGNVLKKHPYLLPFYYIRLNFKRFFLTGKESRKSYQAMNYISDDQIEKAKELMRRCGL